MSTPDQFRVGETWISPRGTQWYVRSITNDLRAVLICGTSAGGVRQYRNTRRVDGWTRVDG